MILDKLLYCCMDMGEIIEYYGVSCDWLGDNCIYKNSVAMVIVRLGNILNSDDSDTIKKLNSDTVKNIKLIQSKLEKDYESVEDKDIISLMNLINEEFWSELIELRM